MSNFIRLVQNEQMKIYARLRTWIMLAVLVLGVIGMAALMKYSAGPAGLDHVLQFMSMATNMTFLVTIFTVIIAGDTVASEFSWGTVKLLLIRPASRSKILAAKYISVLLFFLVTILLLFISSYFVGLILFGVSGTLAPDATITEIVKEYLLNAVAILMSATLAFMISAAFRSSSLAIGLSIFLMFTGNTITLLAHLGQQWVKYILFANTDLKPYFYEGTPPVPGMTLSFSVTMLVAYWIVFYAVAWALFTKRDIAGH